MTHVILETLPGISAFLVGYGLCYINERLHNADTEKKSRQAPTDGRDPSPRGTSEHHSEFSSLSDD